MARFLLVLVAVSLLAIGVHADDGPQGVKSTESIQGGTKIEFHGMDIDAGRSRREGMDGRDRPDRQTAGSNPLPSQLIVSAWTSNGLVGAVLTRPEDVAAYLRFNQRRIELDQKMDALKTEQAELESAFAPFGLQLEKERKLELNHFEQVRVYEEQKAIHTEQVRIIHRTNSEATRAAQTPAPQPSPSRPAPAPQRREYHGK